MLLITIFVELCVVAGRSRTRAGSPTGRLWAAVLFRGHEKNGMDRAWHGRGIGMASVNQTRPHCVNQMGKTHSKPLAARHGMGAAWARHAMCESALRVPATLSVVERGRCLKYTTHLHILPPWERQR
jgi:hypothetical protein